MGLVSFLSGTATQLRGLTWLALSDTGQVGSGTFTDDGGGGGTLGWAYGSDVPCRIDPLDSPEARVTAGRIDERSTHLLTLPLGTELALTNRFLIDGRGTFEVTALKDTTASSLTLAEVTQIT